jgi:uncharacterized protein (UPF0303 family)
LKYERAKTTLHAATGLELKDFAPHGGCFPILLAGTGCVGTIAVSGPPQREDHALWVEVLQEYLKLGKRIWDWMQGRECDSEVVAFTE